MADYSFEELERFSNNPNRLISLVYDRIEEGLDTDTEGTLNSTLDPFAYCVDLVIGTHSAFVNRLEDSVSKGYLVHARTISDLAKHMSDDDWTGVFAEPSQTTLRFLIPVDEIKRLALPYNFYDNNLLNFYNKLVIPKDTQIEVIDTTFWLEHAVEIRVMSHGSLQVLYDTTQSSPFATLGTNYPDREYVRLSDKLFLAIYLPVRQVSITMVTNKSSNSVVGFSLVQAYDDNLYKVRAFIKRWDTNTRQEMTVIYNRDSYDTGYPTLTIDLLDGNQFRASIPTVYLENGLGIGDITLVIYTTKGAYSRELSGISSTYFSPEYYNVENNKGALGEYEKPVLSINGMLVDAYTAIRGGRDAKTFSELKSTMIYAHRRRDIPISPVDLTQKLKDAGYSAIKSIDYPNSRLYRVTKSLPNQPDKQYDTETGVRYNSRLGIYVGSVLTSINELEALGVGKRHDNRFTIFPGNVLEVTDTETFFWANSQTSSVMNSSAKNKIDVYNEHTLVTNDFHYVLDTSDQQARIRPYYFDNPKIVQQTFFYENPYLGITLGIGKDGISITRKTDGSGFYIEVVTNSSEEYKEISDDNLSIQVGYDTSSSGRKTAKGFLVGTNESGERKWGFNLNTDFDIDHNNQIAIKGFRQYGVEQSAVRADLTQTMSFIFVYKGDSTREKSTSDTKIDQSLFDGQMTAIVETEFTVSLGRYLNHLYYAIRPMVGAKQYQVYDKDVPQTYTENTYQYNNGQLVIKDGKAVIEHARGDVMKDSEGNIIYQHRKGQPVYDSDGELVMLADRDIRYYWDFVGFDFAYALSQDDYDTDYFDEMKRTIAEDIMDELDVLGLNRLERTTILFKPKSSIGYTRALVNESQELYLKNDLNFKITYYLEEGSLEDKSLERALRDNTHEVINNILIKNTLSRSDVIKSLSPDSTSDVVGIVVTILSGDREIEVVSNIDTTDGFAVRKKLIVTGDGFLTVEEDIDINFKEHGLKSEGNVFLDTDNGY